LQKYLSVIDSTYYANNAMLCFRNNFVGHVTEEIFNSFDEEVKTYLSIDFTDWENERQHFSVEF